MCVFVIPLVSSMFNCNAIGLNIIFMELETLFDEKERSNCATVTRMKN